MMKSHVVPPATADAIADRVRRNAGNAFLPAILITLIGWLLLEPLKAPVGLTATTFAGTIWVLRFAGPLLFVAAVFGRLSGRLVCFLLDAVLSTCVALSLLMTVVTVFDDLVRGSLNALIFAVFAAVYVRAAWCLWSEYFSLRRADATAGPAPAARGQQPRSSPSMPDPAGEPPGASADSAARTIPPVADQPPPDGFLASLAYGEAAEDEKQ